MLHVDYAQTMLKTFIAISLEPVNSLSTKQKFLMILWMYVTAYSEITSSLTFRYSIFGQYLVHLFFSFFTSLWFFFTSTMIFWVIFPRGPYYPFSFGFAECFCLITQRDCQKTWTYLLDTCSVSVISNMDCLFVVAVVGLGKKNVSCLW